MSTKSSYVAVYDFHGDPRLRQLAFQRNAVVQISRDQEPQNGWLWATCYGQTGWIPSWAVAYQPPSLALPPPPLVAERNGNRPRLSDIIDAPVGSPRGAGAEPHPEVSQGRSQAPDIADPNDDDESNGFDLSHGVMGGQAPRAEPEPSDPAHEEIARDGDRNEKDSKRSRFIGRFLKAKVQPVFQPKAKEPEWNPLPQIIYDGKVIQEYSVKKRGLFQLPNVHSQGR
jgi:hypothetical protein